MTKANPESKSMQANFSKAAGQLFDERGSIGSGMLISPKLFLTAGHCVLPESGEYVLLDDGGEEYKRAIPSSGKTRDELMDMDNKQLANLMTAEALEYNPNIEMEDVGGELVQELNQGLNVSFYNETGDIIVNIGGKVLCAIRSDDYSMDFALIELENSVEGIKIPQLSTETISDEGYIFHYPNGGARTLSVAEISKPASDSYAFKLSYKANTKDQSSGSAIMSGSGKIVGIHTDRDLIIEDTINKGDEKDLEKIKENIKNTDEFFARIDGGLVHGVPIGEILTFQSKATEKFINTLTSNGVTILSNEVMIKGLTTPTTIPTPIGITSQVSASQLFGKQESVFQK